MKYIYQCNECEDEYTKDKASNNYYCTFAGCDSEENLELIRVEGPDESTVYGNDCKGGCET